MKSQNKKIDWNKQKNLRRIKLIRSKKLILELNLLQKELELFLAPWDEQLLEEIAKIEKQKSQF
jgi:hypothetical protein